MTPAPSSHATEHHMFAETRIIEGSKVLINQQLLLFALRNVKWSNFNDGQAIVHANNTRGDHVTSQAHAKFERIFDTAANEDLTAGMPSGRISLEYDTLTKFLFRFAPLEAPLVVAAMKVASANWSTSRSLGEPHPMLRRTEFVDLAHQALLRHVFDLADKSTKAKKAAE